MKLIVGLALFALTACGSSAPKEEAKPAAEAPAAEAKAEEAALEAAPEEAAPKADAAEAAPEAADLPPATRLNLNTAPEASFKALPGVGDKMAHEFEEYRPYVSIAQFRKEMSKYVDAETISGYEKHVFVPISVNESDAATLEQAVSAESAAALLAKRPFADNDAFLAAVVELEGQEAADSIKGMLQ